MKAGVMQTCSAIAHDERGSGRMPKLSTRPCLAYQAGIMISVFSRDNVEQGHR